MFAYCNNNPVNFVDSNGQEPYALLKSWVGGMWWLCAVDTFLPIGDAIYGVGVIVFAVCTLFVVDEVILPQITLEEGQEKSEPDPPEVTYPGDDPKKAPEGTTWKGKGEQGGKQGNYHNPNTGESWHPDLDHPDPIGPHWDYRDSTGRWWRIGYGDKFTLK